MVQNEVIHHALLVVKDDLTPPGVPPLNPANMTEAMAVATNFMRNGQTSLSSSSFGLPPSARNKIGFIDRSLPIPPSHDSNFQVWKQGNSLIKAWTNNCVASDILASISTSNTAEELWSEIKERYSIANETRVYEVYKELGIIKQKGLTVTEYYSKLKSLWKELQEYETFPTCSSCTTHKIVKAKRDREKLMQFLIGLNEEYSHVSSQVLLTKPFPDIKTGFNMILQEEMKQKVTNMDKGSSNEVMAMVVNKFNNALSKKNYKNSQPDKDIERYKRDNKGGRPPSANKETLFCRYCRKDSHTIDKCYKLHGNPNNPTKKFKSNNSNRNYSANQVKGTGQKVLDQQSQLV
ncbi:uncharacterized protein LOC120005962 [Tripterygium wilfordii]|uniref:uncharacterized protein LOC120005962 n=1 Tax=Tripterygium wilfordii TaxID=458696 RepID=UPI0018F825AC|nr:uncharacterized protein LOC120005962 [Tripterygium wilfordii]